MIILCKQCGIEFKVSKYRSKTAKYCSRRCLALAYRVQIETECKICGKKFEHISSRANKAKYCSRKCYYKSLKNKGSKKFICKFCRKEFLDSPSKKRIYCSRACINKDYKTKWKKDFKDIKKIMKIRNMIKHCDRCGFSEYPEILSIHHKDNNPKNNDITNLEILCPNCHSIRHLKKIFIRTNHF